VEVEVYAERQPLFPLNRGSYPVALVVQSADCISRSTVLLLAGIMQGTKGRDYGTYKFASGNHSGGISLSGLVASHFLFVQLKLYDVAEWCARAA
jgi:hypothetical protein